MYPVCGGMMINSRVVRTTNAGHWLAKTSTYQFDLSSYHMPRICLGRGCTSVGRLLNSRGRKVEEVSDLLRGKCVSSAVCA